MSLVSFSRDWRRATQRVKPGENQEIEHTTSKNIADSDIGKSKMATELTPVINSGSDVTDAIKY